MTWTKMPSVSSGGKPYFYTTRDAQDRRYVVLWDRQNLCWSAELPNGQVVTYFTNLFRAKSFVEDYIRRNAVQTTEVR